MGCGDVVMVWVYGRVYLRPSVDEDGQVACFFKKSDQWILTVASLLGQTQTCDDSEEEDL